jgi:hypothetical protein
MLKLRSAVFVAGLLGAALLAPVERANAHTVTSTWNDISTGAFFFFHQSPDLAAWTYVGYDPNGFWVGATTAVSGTNATYDLLTYDRCNSGAITNSGWVEVFGEGYWVRGSGCPSSGLWQGRVSIRP